MGILKDIVDMDLAVGGARVDVSLVGAVLGRKVAPDECPVDLVPRKCHHAVVKLSILRLLGYLFGGVCAELLDAVVDFEELARLELGRVLIKLPQIPNFQRLVLRVGSYVIPDQKHRSYRKASD